MSSKQFTVHLIDAANHRMRAGGAPPIRVEYEGDDFDAATSAARLLAADPNNILLTVRFYNFALFGGGIKDTLITAEVSRKARGDTAPPSGSVQCPHCKWGFAPSVIDQHIREKHADVRASV